MMPTPEATPETDAECVRIDKTIDRWEQALSAMTEHARSLERRLSRVVAFVQEFADEDCEYGDDCPIHSRKHYRCIPCKARAELAALEGKQ